MPFLGDREFLHTNGERYFQQLHSDGKKTPTRPAPRALMAAPDPLYRVSACCAIASEQQRAFDFERAALLVSNSLIISQ